VVPLTTRFKHILPFKALIVDTRFNYWRNFGSGRQGLKICRGCVYYPVNAKYSTQTIVCIDAIVSTRTLGLARVERNQV
jgi:hypothetical protein